MSQPQESQPHEYGPFEGPIRPPVRKVPLEHLEQVIYKDGQTGDVFRDPGTKLEFDTSPLQPGEARTGDRPDMALIETRPGKMVGLIGGLAIDFDGQDWSRLPAEPTVVTLYEPSRLPVSGAGNPTATVRSVTLHYPSSLEELSAGVATASQDPTAPTNPFVELQRVHDDIMHSTQTTYNA